MPVILKKTIKPNSIIGLWELQEDEAYFLDRMTLSEEEDEHLSRIKGKRRLHWLCSRYLLHLLTEKTDRLACIKDQYGKPQLKDSPLQISFSHSEDLVSVAISDKPIGIDIQIRVDKIQRIRYKFINSEEDKYVDEDEIDRLHVIWGAKESAFKAYGRKQVDFKLHQRFVPISDDTFELKFQKPNEDGHHFIGAHEQWGDYTLVYLMEA